MLAYASRWSVNVADRNGSAETLGLDAVRSHAVTGEIHADVPDPADGVRHEKLAGHLLGDDVLVTEDG
jgi:hypothetical protein